jgi:hypothetical protein
MVLVYYHKLLPTFPADIFGKPKQCWQKLLSERIHPTKKQPSGIQNKKSPTPE